MAKILIAEDEPDIQALLALILRHSGHEVIAAGDGQAAQDLALKEKPDLIILDVQMPKVNGYDACKLIKAQPGLQDIPVLFLTVRGDQNEKQTGLAAGAAAYLVKPFASEELVHWVSEILSRSKLH